MQKCIQKTGILGQLRYAAINVLMLSGYNTPWPDSGRELWRHKAQAWQTFQTIFIAIPALLTIFTCFWKRTVTHHGILAVHLWAIVVTAAIYFGDTRMRAPYDPMILLLAIEVYVFLGVTAIGRLRRRKTAS
jgi:hypothetical protein